MSIISPPSDPAGIHVTPLEAGHGAFHHAELGPTDINVMYRFQ